MKSLRVFTLCDRHSGNVRARTASISQRTLTMRLLTLLTSLLLAAFLFAQQDAPSHSRVLLAVFAHPDDEVFAGPTLTRYAREGVHVYLAIATKGEKGTTDFATIPACDPLAAARRTESTCPCQQLRTEPPAFFNLNHAN